MIRIRLAVELRPRITTGIQMCLSRSTNLAQDQGAFWYSGENRPETSAPK